MSRISYSAISKSHGYDDDAVIRHIKDAMTLVLIEPGKAELAREKDRKEHVRDRLAELVNEFTEYTINLEHDDCVQQSRFEN